MKLFWGIPLAQFFTRMFSYIPLYIMKPSKTNEINFTVNIRDVIGHLKSRGYCEARNEFLCFVNIILTYYQSSKSVSKQQPQASERNKETKSFDIRYL